MYLALMHSAMPCRERHKGPVAIVMEVPGGSAKAVREMPLLTEFPLIEVAVHSADSAYPSLQWQPRAVKIAVLRLIAAGVWVRVSLIRLIAVFLIPCIEGSSAGLCLH